MARGSKRKSDAEQHQEDLMDLVPKEPLQIVGIACDPKGNVVGLGNNGKLYKYNTDMKEWVMV